MILLWLLRSLKEGKVIEPFDFYDWLFFRDGKIRKFWGIFFSFGVGAFVAFYALTNAPLMLCIALLCAVGVAQFAFYNVPPTASVRPQSVEIPQTNVAPPIPYGVIYVMRRSDGILKFGKTLDLRQRVQSHRKDYRMSFETVAAWVVPDTDRYESAALLMTSKYAYSEGNRRELRQMSEAELNQFVLDFTEKVYYGFKKTA